MLPISDFAPPKTRVLVVDDNDDLRLTLCECFESLNLSVFPARSGVEAIRLLQGKRHTFDIIFTNLNMPPGPSGLDVLKIALQTYPASYVVVMTGSSTIHTAIQSIQYGAYDYLVKPVQLEEIEIVTKRIREHISLLDDNRRLSRRLDSLIERFAAIGSRLDCIENVLGKLATGLLHDSRTLTP